MKATKDMFRDLGKVFKMWNETHGNEWVGSGDLMSLAENDTKFRARVIGIDATSKKRTLSTLLTKLSQEGESYIDLGFLVERQRSNKGNTYRLKRAVKRVPLDQLALEMRLEQEKAKQESPAPVEEPQVDVPSHIDSPCCEAVAFSGGCFDGTLIEMNQVEDVESSQEEVEVVPVELQEASPEEVEAAEVIEVVPVEGVEVQEVPAPEVVHSFDQDFREVLGIPFGLDLAPNRQGMVYDPVEADIIRKMAKVSRLGFNPRVVALAFNESSQFRRGKLWSENTVNAVLENKR